MSVSRRKLLRPSEQPPRVVGATNVSDTRPIFTNAGRGQGHAQNLSRFLGGCRRTSNAPREADLRRHGSPRPKNPGTKVTSARHDRSRPRPTLCNMMISGSTM